jgi:type IV pilus assembly protein PilN
MIRINLLPFRAARKKENIRRQVSIFFLSIFLVTVILCYYHVRLAGKIETLDKKVENTKKEVAKYNKIVKEIGEIKKKLSVLKRKTDVIENLELNQEKAVRLLDNMTQMVIKKRMWFTSFAAQGDAVDIKGIAIDNKTVADFMTRLEESENFKSVKLKTTKQERLSNKKVNLKSFDITCNMVPIKKDETSKAKK